MQGSARGTALVMAAMAVPVLLIAVWKASRNAGAALLVWPARCCTWCTTPCFSCFSRPSTPPSWSTWRCSVLAVVTRIPRRHTRAAARRQSIADHAPVRGVASYGGSSPPSTQPRGWPCSSRLWLSYPTPMLESVGVQTNARSHIQDLAVWLPLAAVAALCCAGGSLEVRWWWQRAGYVGHRRRPASQRTSGSASTRTPTPRGVFDRGCTVPRSRRSWSGATLAPPSRRPLTPRIDGTTNWDSCNATRPARTQPALSSYRHPASSGELSETQQGPRCVTTPRVHLVTVSLRRPAPRSIIWLRSTPCQNVTGRTRTTRCTRSPHQSGYPGGALPATLRQRVLPRNERPSIMSDGSRRHSAAYPSVPSGADRCRAIARPASAVPRGGLAGRRSRRGQRSLTSHTR